MRRLTPFNTYTRSFHRSKNPHKAQSELAPLAQGEYAFMVLLVRLSNCLPPKEQYYEYVPRIQAGSPGST